MRRNILVMLLFLFVVVISASAVSPKQQQNKKNEVEILIKKISRVDSPQIDYTYVSCSMIQRMFASLKLNMPVVEELLGSLKSIRSVSTQGRDGYTKVRKMIEPFLQEENEVMELSLISSSRENGIFTVLYANDDCMLVVDDDGNTSISIVLIIGISYESYQKILEGGVDFIDINI